MFASNMCIRLAWRHESMLTSHPAGRPACRIASNQDGMLARKIASTLPYQQERMPASRSSCMKSRKPAYIEAAHQDSKQSRHPEGKQANALSWPSACRHDGL
jgi:hypothetical protein